MLKDNIEWRENLSGEEWDNLLAQHNGHPLQSSLWGDARKSCMGISDYRWALFDGEELLGMIRFEVKSVFGLKKIIWSPQLKIENKEFEIKLVEKLKKHGFIIWTKSLYLEESFETSRKTIVLDLTIGKKALWENLDKQFRYGVRCAEKKLEKCDYSKDIRDIRKFNDLCEILEKTKNFNSNSRSERFFSCLLDTDLEKKVGAKLFLVKKEESIGAGALVLYSGKNLHYMWGAVDRKYSKDRLGEFIQWSIIEWAFDYGFEHYDLEGIDEVKNPGVAAFKKKFGGKVINFSDITSDGLTVSGKLLSTLIKRFL